MGKYLCSILILLVHLNLNFINAGRSLLKDGDDAGRSLLRQKRFLLFNPNGGVAKYVAGYLGPIDTEKFINCNAIRNFQFQYDLPTNITTIFSKVPARQRSMNGEPHFKPDTSRKIAYELVEAVLAREGKNGRECLLRTICEVAETPMEHNGLVGELLQTFFTPGKHEKLPRDYIHARQAGINRIDCVKLFPDCPFGDGILDSVSLIEEFRFNDWLNFWDSCKQILIKKIWKENENSSRLVSMVATSFGGSFSGKLSEVLRRGLEIENGTETFSPSHSACKFQLWHLQLRHVELRHLWTEILLENSRQSCGNVKRDGNILISTFQRSNLRRVSFIEVVDDGATALRMLK